MNKKSFVLSTTSLVLIVISYLIFFEVITIQNSFRSTIYGSLDSLHATPVLWNILNIPVTLFAEVIGLLDKIPNDHETMFFVTHIIGLVLGIIAVVSLRNSKYFRLMLGILIAPLLLDGILFALAVFAAIGMVRAF